MSFSNYLEQLILNATLRHADITGTAVYVSLHTEDPTEAGTAGELVPASTSYDRIIASFDAPEVDGTGYLCHNTAAIEFTEAAESWGHISHFGIWDAETAGNCLYTGELTTHKDIGIGDQFVIKTGSLTVKLD